MSYNDQRELKSLPATIEKLETSLSAIHAEMAAPGFYQQAAKLMAAKQAEEADLRTKLAATYERWEELDQ